MLPHAGAFKVVLINTAAIQDVGTVGWDEKEEVLRQRVLSGEPSVRRINSNP